MGWPAIVDRSNLESRTHQFRAIDHLRGRHIGLLVKGILNEFLL